MESVDQKIERARALLREAYAILSQFQEPNIRPESNLALLSAIPAPSPLPPLGPPIIAPLGEPEEVE